MTRWTIDGRQVAPEHIGPPPMNYGQHARWSDNRRVRYTLEVERAALLRALDGFIEELSASERQEMADGLDAMDLVAIERFRGAGLPGLAEMLDGVGQGAHELLAGLFELFDLTVLEALSAPPDVSGGVYYVLASLDACRFDAAAGAVIEGVAYEVAVAHEAAVDVRG